MKNIGSTLWYWRLSIVRCLLYACIVAWGVFKAGTQGYEHWGDMSVFQRMWLFGDMFVAAGGVILAFLDNSLQNLSRDTGRVVARAEVSVDKTPEQDSNTQKPTV